MVENDRALGRRRPFRRTMGGGQRRLADLTSSSHSRMAPNHGSHDPPGQETGGERQTKDIIRTGFQGPQNVRGKRTMREDKDRGLGGASRALAQATGQFDSTHGGNIDFRQHDVRREGGGHPQDLPAVGGVPYVFRLEGFQCEVQKLAGELVPAGDEKT